MGEVERYAYVHSAPNASTADGIFYVGKGTQKRARMTWLSQRSARYVAVAKQYGHGNIDVGMIACSSDAIALKLERGLIKCLTRMGISLANKMAGSVVVDGRLLPEEAKTSLVSYDTIHQRVSAGWSMDDAIKTPANGSNNRNYKYSTVDGVTATTKEHCARLGVSYALVSKRITKYGFTVEAALKTPVRAARWIK